MARTKVDMETNAETNRSEQVYTGTDRDTGESEQENVRTLREVFLQQVTMRSGPNCAQPYSRLYISSASKRAREYQRRAISIFLFRPK